MLHILCREATCVWTSCGWALRINSVSKYEKKKQANKQKTQFFRKQYSLLLNKSFDPGLYFIYFPSFLFSSSFFFFYTVAILKTLSVLSLLLMSPQPYIPSLKDLYFVNRNKCVRARLYILSSWIEISYVVYK